LANVSCSTGARRNWRAVVPRIQDAGPLSALCRDPARAQLCAEPHPSKIRADRDRPFGAIQLRSENVKEMMRYDRRKIVRQRLLAVSVECYAGHRGEQTPRTLILGDRRIAVEEVLDAWLAPDYRYFKLRGADGDTYLVRHDERSNLWELTMF